MDLKRILFGAVVVIIIYIFYTSVFADKSKTNLVNLHNATEDLSIKASKLSGAGSTNYTYSFWIYVNDYNINYGEKKLVLQRKHVGTDNTYYPRIYLGENQNDMHFEISYKNQSNTVEQHKIDIKTIPLQKWNHIIMTKSGDTIDIYIDGKLVKTSIMPNVAEKPHPETDITLTPVNEQGNKGFSGYLSKINYFSNAINTREAYQLYKEGYGSGFLGSFFNRFKLKFAFLQDNQEKSSIIL